MVVGGRSRGRRSGALRGREGRERGEWDHGDTEEERDTITK